jgi:chromosome segregation ATPase
MVIGRVKPHSRIWMVNWTFVGLLATTLAGCDAHRADHWVTAASSRAKGAAGSIESGWKDINNRAETLDLGSSVFELEKTRRRLLTKLAGAAHSAQNDYARTRAEIAKIDAAERFKDAQRKIEDLKKSGRVLANATGAASKEIDDLTKKASNAKAAYETARTKASQFLP